MDSILIEHYAMAEKQEGYITPAFKAIQSFSHGSVVELKVVTPLGQRVKASTIFIGADYEHYIFLKLPNLSKKNRDIFIIQGYSIIIESTPFQSRGVKHTFQTKIAHWMLKPFPLLLLDFPLQMTLYPQRQSVRYDLDLTGVINLPDRKFECKLVNISQGGFAFSFEAFGPGFDIGQSINLDIENQHNGHQFALTGHVKSLEKINGTQICGVMFDEVGKDNGKRIIEQLTHTGDFFVFQSEQT